MAVFGANVPKLEVLATLQSELLLGLAGSALQTQDDLLGGLGLLVEDGLGLTTVTGLLAVVTTLSLSRQRVLALLVLRHLVGAYIQPHREYSFHASTTGGTYVCFLQVLPLQSIHNITINTLSPQTFRARAYRSVVSYKHKTFNTQHGINTSDYILRDVDHFGGCWRR